MNPFDEHRNIQPVDDHNKSHAIAEVLQMVNSDMVYCCPDCDYSSFYLIAGTRNLESFAGFQCANEDCQLFFKFPKIISRKKVLIYKPELTDDKKEVKFYNTYEGEEDDD